MSDPDTSTATAMRELAWAAKMVVFAAASALSLLLVLGFLILATTIISTALGNLLAEVLFP